MSLVITRMSLMISWIGMGNVDPTVFYKDFYINILLSRSREWVEEEHHKHLMNASYNYEVTEFSETLSATPDLF